MHAVAVVGVQVTARALFTHARDRDPTLPHWNNGNTKDNMVAGATIAVGSVSGVTNADGQVTLNLSSLADGPATMTFTAPTALQGTLAAGPNLLSAATSLPDRSFRTLSLPVTIHSGLLDTSTAPTFAAGVDNGRVVTAGTNKLAIDWKPDFVLCPHNRPRVDPIKVIVVHRTGGPSIGSAINEFIGSAGSGIHYLIDVDGFVVKMVRDEEVAPHAGDSFWHGDLNVSDVSVGIEMVNGSGPFPAEQINALIALIRALQAAHGLTRHTVVTHCDVAVDTSRVRAAPHTKINLTLSNRRHEDPGPDFDHSTFKTNNIGTGPIPVPPPPPGAAAPYGGLFTSHPTVTLRTGDNDGTKTYGGKLVPGITSAVIGEIQTDLMTIGYSISAATGITVSSVYDLPTSQAVNAFQRHFMNAGNGASGRVDSATASTIKGVLADLATP